MYKFKTPPRTQNRRGFTLVELLVVIAIMSILAAILFPVFATARESARTSACLSNLKQLGTAFQMYQQDHDGRFPKGWNLLSPAANGFGAHTDPADPIDCWTHWPWFYAQYVKNIEIYDCPTSPTGLENITRANWNNNGNYGYNYDGISRDVTLKVRNDASIMQPAEVFVFFDSGDSAVRPGTNNRAGFLGDLDLDWANPTKEAAIRHRGRTNVVYADGHAKSLAPDQFVKRVADNVPPWMIDWSDCNPICNDPPFDASKYQ